MTTVHFHTYGCKVNQYETRAMRGMLEAAGFVTGEMDAVASDTVETGAAMSGDTVLVVNSCTVTGESDRKLRRQLRRLRREHPAAVIVLTGCMPQAFPDEAAALEEADLVLGNAARRRLPDLLSRYLAERERIVDIPPHDAAFEPMRINAFEGRTRAFVKIEDGCDRACAYCVIPRARGRVRSKPPDALRAELEGLAAGGYTEAVLVGINLTAYGRDLGPAAGPLPLCDAVDAACAVEGLRRVRLGSLEPDRLDPATLDRLAAAGGKLCPQFHLSLQSGCEATLRRMNRRYTPAQYLALCGALRARFPGCALTADVMAGFPGETPEEFAESLAFVREAGFARAHVFAYSPRPGTPAAAAAGQVPAGERNRRARVMAAVCEQSRDRFLDGLVGQTVEVLAELRGGGGLWEGYTPHYMSVRFPGCASDGGQLRPVRVTGHENGIGIGEKVSNL